jgi:ribonucleoside-diphosphate reductase beta chain
MATEHRDNPTRPGIDREERAYRYYRNAVERHWDPSAIDLTDDVAGLVEMDREALDGLRASLAKFGAGEQAVTEDLAPLSVVLADIEDQSFITTQLYEEAKHTDFFDRYWTEVVNAAERERGMAETSPHEDRWYNDEYDELFARNEAAMDRLLTEDSPENRAKAYCHYHLTIEGILAQTGYFGLQTAYGPNEPALPTLSGLNEGLDSIRRDEGRHVGFGMLKLKELIEEQGVDPQILSSTVDELLPLVAATTAGAAEEREGDPGERPGPSPEDLRTYATEKHTQRMQQIVNASAEIPDVESLVAIRDPGDV